jgi:hypothetical protein
VRQTSGREGDPEHRERADAPRFRLPGDEAIHK